MPAESEQQVAGWLQNALWQQSDLWHGRWLESMRDRLLSVWVMQVVGPRKNAGGKALVGEQIWAPAHIIE